MSNAPTGDTAAAANRKAFIKGGVVFALLGGILIGGSGDAAWLEGWLFCAVMLAAQIVAFRTMQRQPGLVAERSKLQAGTKVWDKWILALLAFVLPLLAWIGAALDHRYRWSGHVPVALEVAGFALLILGTALMDWAVAVNRFFSATVRIQSERGHAVVSDGPYSHVRHPGYVGMALFALGTPLALGSWIAFAPTALTLATLVLRTALEDRTLRSELDGYLDYTRSVRARLVPHVW
jgi:protein-S-isoprenylcysteine O-methyltransferase Ste14